MTPKQFQGRTLRVLPPSILCFITYSPMLHVQALHYLPSGNSNQNEKETIKNSTCHPKIRNRLPKLIRMGKSIQLLDRSNENQ